ncbi:hypothetical protein LCGC14_2822660, partial [marine sediment metagenome]
DNTISTGSESFWDFIEIQKNEKTQKIQDADARKYKNKIFVSLNEHINALNFKLKFKLNKIFQEECIKIYDEILDFLSFYEFYKSFGARKVKNPNYIAASLIYFNFARLGENKARKDLAKALNLSLSSLNSVCSTVSRHLKGIPGYYFILDLINADRLTEDEYLSLLESNVDEYIGYAMKKGIIVSSLHTNGILLTEQISQSLIDSGLTLIIFSIDAINEGTYQEIRRNKDYNKIIKNIYKLIELKQKTNSKFPFIRVSFSKNKVNYRDLPQFIKYWEDKIDDISISSFCNPFVGKRKYYEMEEIYRLESSYLGTCYEPNQRLIVFSNGNVGPCCSFFAEELIVGNIYKDSIYDIWNGVQMEDIRLSVNGNILQQTIVCRKCRFSKVDNFLENN